MMPAELAALLRLRRVREERAQAAVQAARRAEQEAAVLRGAAEQARAAFAEAARRRRDEAFGRLDEGRGMAALVLQAAAAELAGLREQESGIATAVRRAVTAEAGRRAGTEAACQKHAAAQRAAEALNVLDGGFRSAAAAAAERTEEAEAEEPRARP